MREHKENDFCEEKNGNKERQMVKNQGIKEIIKEKNRNMRRIRRTKKERSQKRTRREIKSVKKEQKQR